ncbi:MAG TPA: hypothetical protein VM580_20695, partial [Labilithrix sp.]|nr:hypothetical protein [Labilithrix sp.]
MRQHLVCNCVVIAFVGLISLGGCGGGTLGDDCDVESDCASDFSCVECSVRNTCYYDDLLDDDGGFERACSAYGSGSPTDSRYS